ncbi:hypothetical protein IQ266_00865 [filamentous cyanobacterium LEGE 11480]|uniref:Uncharacterized protein n=1 Tax=Romeriopsis navalis LEGE 11480 TaxID=2777977 RepID=A0A928Z0I5_9CYAN|nr:hypothetical protein [Romeriopsis navalis]MBE9028306.1 hypothetical protein [Romeriopsis navalis LEGE 11480]
MNKTVFLVISMVPWILVGGALIYLAPAIADQLLHSETTHMWLTTLGRGGYYPKLATAVAIGMSLVGTALTIIGSKYLPSDRRIQSGK